MEAYAVVETGGKQYLVHKNETLDVEKLPGEKGAALKIGAPAVAGAAIAVEIVDQFRGVKLISFKKKRRKGYQKKIGHRQSLTRLTIKDIKVG